jgi:hypothetical protein
MGGGNDENTQRGIRLDGNIFAAQSRQFFEKNQYKFQLLHSRAAYQIELFWIPK